MGRYLQRVTWFNVCFDKISFKSAQSKVLDQGHSTGSSLEWPWVCHLLSQDKSSFIKSSKIMAFVFGSASRCLVKGSWMMSVFTLRKITLTRVIVIPTADTTPSNLTTISHRSVCEQGWLTSQKERDNGSSESLGIVLTLISSHWPCYWEWRWIAMEIYIHPGCFSIN